jgi:hypothetical protein
VDHSRISKFHTVRGRLLEYAITSRCGLAIADTANSVCPANRKESVNDEAFQTGEA